MVVRFTSSPGLRPLRRPPRLTVGREMVPDRSVAARGTGRGRFGPAGGGTFRKRRASEDREQL